jgi:hypothetical protein
LGIKGINGWKEKENKLRGRGMWFGKVKSMHEDGMMANVLSPVIQQPPTNWHNGVGGKTARSEVSSPACADGLAGCIVREIRDKFLEEPGVGRNWAILA